ncbi:FAD binding domain-containing [Fusarium albosuccineum]|uniref:FAD binding domain-containing n=1 Tax=Fusarium albosuccineum TaxID=1237068 RepID=A0A8H4L309_9HYPO|nr:FAD binding domain-containing [Fusarium albosuccineum]
MSGEGLDPLKRYIVKGIAAGVGLASESITSYKERRKTASRSPGTASSEAEHSPPSRNTSIDGIYELTGSQTEIYELSGDQTQIYELPDHTESTLEEAQWRLDEAQDELLPHYRERPEEPSSYSQEISGAVDLGQNLINRYPLPSSPEVITKLPNPVILPQRRPKTRKRGFIRAYAPVLNDTGISQDMFLDFLETFHTSTQASPWLDAINLASMGLSLIPHFPMVVGIAIQMSIIAAKDIQNRTRTNAFLDKANDDFFRPRGLYCLIMTYSPDTETSHEQKDISATIASAMNPSTSQKLYGKFKESKGTTYGEVELPEAAPLVFPVLDDPATQSDGAKSKKTKIEDTQNYVREYFDKRAQAKFAGKYSGSSLVQGPTPKFTSRYADPNHPASSGSFRSLVTGGKINPPSLSSQRRLSGVVGGWCENYDGRQQAGDYTLRDHVIRTTSMMSLGSPRGRHAPYGGQQQAEAYPNGLAQRINGRGRGSTGDNIQVGPLSVPGPRGMVKKALKSNILYLMVVNMPSDEELAQAAAEIERRRNEGTKMSDILKRFTEY